jgi:hypothetical protein
MATSQSQSLNLTTPNNLTSLVGLPLSLFLQNVSTVCSDGTQSGTTAQRPTTNLYIGRTFFDTTLDKSIRWNGTSWAIPASQSDIDNSVNNVTSGTVANATSSLNIFGGGMNEIPYQTGYSTTKFIPAPQTQYSFLSWNGLAFQWQMAGSVSTISINTANGFAGTVTNPTSIPSITLSTTVTGILYGNGTSVATAVAGNFPTLNQNTTGYSAGIAGGSGGELVYQSALNTTGFTAAGTTGQVLTSTWTTLNTIAPTSINGTVNQIDVSSSIGSVTISLDPNITGITSLVSTTATFITVTEGLVGTNVSTPTIPSTTSISPTTPISFISGTTLIITIVAPSPISTNGGQITLIPTGIFTTNTGGNIALASTAVLNKALIMTYDATSALWYPSY